MMSFSPLTLVNSNSDEEITFSLFFELHQDLATAGKRAVRPPAGARSGGKKEAILRKSIL